MEKPKRAEPLTIRMRQRSYDRFHELIKFRIEQGWHAQRNDIISDAVDMLWEEELKEEGKS